MDKLPWNMEQKFKSNDPPQHHIALFHQVLQAVNKWL